MRRRRWAGESKEKANTEAALAFLLQKKKKRPNDWQVYIKIMQILTEGGMSKPLTIKGSCSTFLGPEIY